MQRWWSILAAFLLPALLVACSQEDLERLADRETFAFEGSYDNQHNQDILLFKDGEVWFESDGVQLWKRYFTVKDNQLTIQFSTSSREDRQDLLLRIHGGGEVLTCGACALYQMSHVWVRLDAEPQNN